MLIIATLRLRSAACRNRRIHLKYGRMEECLSATKSFITQEKSSQFNDFFSINNASNLSCRKYGASYCVTFLMEINFLRRFSLKDFYEYTHRYFACVTRIFIRKTVLPIKLSCLICHFYTFPSNTH